MTTIPDYVAQGGDEHSYTIQEIDDLRKRQPTGNEPLTDTQLNEYWHDLMSLEEELLTKLNLVKTQLGQANEEINRRVYRSTLSACVQAVGELTK